MELINIKATDLMSDSREDINNNFISVATDFAGTSFPTDVKIGMVCFRTDQKKSYRYVAANTWRLEADYSTSNMVVPAASAATYDSNGEKIADTYQRADTAFTGATSAQGGKMGLVPKPIAGQQDYYLAGGGDWKEVPKFTLAQFKAYMLETEHPIGSIYISTVSTNPAELFGGTWETFGEGRVLIGANSTYPAGSTGGETTHTLTANEMPSHQHSGSTGASTIARHYHGFGYNNNNGGKFLATSYDKTYEIIGGWRQWNGSNGGGDYTGGNASMNMVTSLDVAQSGSTGSHSHSFTTGATGGSGAHNNMQPYLAVYMWKRTA